MGQEVTDRKAAAPGASIGLTAEGAAKLSTENQAGKQPAYSWTFIPGVDGIPLPIPVPNLQVPPGASGEIEDCSKQKCVVGGKQYTNSEDIPGNHPKPLLHPDGKPVIGPDGKPIIGPERVDLEQITKDILAHNNWLTVPTTLVNFRHSGDLDFQRVKGDDIPGEGARPIFTKPYQNFTNVGVGYVLGSLGLNLNDVAGYSNTYCSLRCVKYNEPLSKQYPYLAERQVKDFEIGINLYKERHPDDKK